MTTVTNCTVNYTEADDIAPLPELHPDEFKSASDLKTVLRDITHDIDVLECMIEELEASYRIPARQARPFRAEHRQ
jgi:hypothetical protein